MWSQLARVTAAAVLAMLPTLVPPTSTSAIGRPALGRAGPGRLP